MLDLFLNMRTHDGCLMYPAIVWCIGCTCPQELMQHSKHAICYMSMDNIGQYKGTTFTTIAESFKKKLCDQVCSALYLSGVLVAFLHQNTKGGVFRRINSLSNQDSHLLFSFLASCIGCRSHSEQWRLKRVTERECKLELEEITIEFITFPIFFTQMLHILLHGFHWLL